MFRLRFAAVLGLAGLVTGLCGPTHAADHKEAVTVNWVPGMTFVARQVKPTGVSVTPDLQVLKADGSPRTYLTQPGQTPISWKLGLPVYQGDKVNLTILVATGGAPLQTLLVRLDNKELTLPATAPWTLSLDTAQLTQGIHFLEAWALTAGPSPFSKDRSSDSTLAFEVVPPPADGGDNGGGGPVIDPVPTDGGGDSGPITPPTPQQLLDQSSILKDQTPDPKAQVVLHLRRTVDALDSLGTVGTVLDVAGLTTVSVDKIPGTRATHYWYAIVRGAVVEVIPGALLNVQTDRLQFFPYDTDPQSPHYKKGLHPGTVTLTIWGVDKDNHPGIPIVTVLKIKG
jgi:hypothetical protein